MESITSKLSLYLSRLGSEMVDIAKELDTTGWVLVMSVMLVCGWFFLKGNKIRST